HEPDLERQLEPLILRLIPEQRRIAFQWLQRPFHRIDDRQLPLQIRDRPMLPRKDQDKQYQHHKEQARHEIGIAGPKRIGPRWLHDGFLLNFLKNTATLFPHRLSAAARICVSSITARSNEEFSSRNSRSIRSCCCAVPVFSSARCLFIVSRYIRLSSRFHLSGYWFTSRSISRNVIFCNSLIRSCVNTFNLSRLSSSVLPTRFTAVVIS